MTWLAKLMRVIGWAGSTYGRLTALIATLVGIMAILDAVVDLGERTVAIKQRKRRERQSLQAAYQGPGSSI